MNKGYFITLEGPDGSGKSTQLELIAEYLRQNGREVVCTREPGGSEAAERLRQLVLDPQLAIDARTETLLYLAARADHLDKVVRPALASGKIVLCDRFSDSTLVYQGFVRGLPLQELLQLNTFATGGLEPDLTLLLDGDAGDPTGADLAPIGDVLTQHRHVFVVDAGCALLAERASLLLGLADNGLSHRGAPFLRMPGAGPGWTGL